MQIKRNLIYLIGVVCMMTSCTEVGFGTSNPSKDGEITFTAKLNSVDTRTLYDEQGIAQAYGAVKVNWVHNDLIKVYGAECTAVPQAEYRVGAVKVQDGTNTPALDANGNEQPVTGQSYANYLQKTGAAGVQWGSATKSDFYAVYPSTNATFTKTDKGAKVQTSIRTVQNNVFKLVTNGDEECWVGTPYIQDLSNPTMPDALMFACNTGVKAADNHVDLTFKPWSTVLKFRFEGFDYTLVGSQQQTVVIRRIILQAPASVDIAGDLELEITKNSDPTKVTAKATPLGQKDNTITIVPDYLPLSASKHQRIRHCRVT